MSDINKLWLPEGEHWGLSIKHQPLEDSGDFIDGGWKFVWHTTEGAGIDAMFRVLRDKRAAPHLLIDPSKGVSRIIQMIPFNQAARALEHPTGTPETNRARCIQCEIVDFAKNAPNWEDWFYRDLAALAVLVEHRVPVRRVTRGFSASNFKKISPQGFAQAHGHMGHQHVPNNSHWDPGAMNGSKLMRTMGEVEDHYA